MAEYIGREAIVKHLRGASIGKYPASFAVGLVAAADEARKIPAADVVEVKWHPVAGYEGLYEVNEYGLIRNSDGKIMKQRLKRAKYTDYKKVSLWKDGKYEHLYVSRIVAEAFIPNPCGLPLVNHKDSKFRPYYKCQCDCGNEVVVRLDCIKSGNTVSCGCYGRKSSGARMSKAMTTHGGSGSRLHRIWKGMHYRCAAVGKAGGKGYADRGVSVCKEWCDFSVFRRWAESNGYTDTLSIDRIDPSGNYCPENCRWATMLEQQRNRRNSLHVEVDGVLIPLTTAAEKAGIPYHTAWRRIVRLGMLPAEALTSPQGGTS